MWVIWSRFPARPGSFQSTQHSIVSRWFWNICREGDSTACLDNLSQARSLTGKKFFLVFRWNFPGISSCPFLLCHCWAPGAEPGPCSEPALLTLTGTAEVSSQPSLEAEQPQLLQPFLTREVLQSPHSLCHPLLLELCVPFVLRCPELDPTLQMCLGRAEQRGKVTSLTWQCSS